MVNRDKSCLVCGAPLSSAPRYPGLLNCNACGFLTANVDLSSDELAALYGHDYFHGSEYGDYTQEKAALQANFSGRIAELSQLPGVSGQSRLFEIGCAYGFFLEMAQNHFAEVCGVDISSDAVAYARDVVHVNAHAGDFLAFEMPFKPDVICMWDVIEHLAAPEKFIARAAEALVPGGYLCITTGDIGSLVARLRGPKWRMVHPPTHLHYFSSTNLQQLLANSGLEPVSLTYPPVVRTVGTVLHGVVSLRLQADELYKLLSRLPGQNISLPINLFDIMFMVVRKPQA